MKANPLCALTGLYPRLKSNISKLLSILTEEAGLVLERFWNHVVVVAGAKRASQEGVVPRRQNRVLPRAERFAIETTIRYRSVGQEGWYQGKTVNISGSGVLFRGKNLVVPKTRVEMIFPLPIRGSGGSGANVTCFGRIVRKVPQVGSKGETGLVATIEEYVLAHAEGVSAA
jgi:hypothetical protein